MSSRQDEIRTNILRALYDVHRNARSAKSASLLISELQALMKQTHGYSKQEVASNLDYLVQIEWVKVVTVTKSVPLKSGTTIDNSRVTYKVSAKGIDKVEGASLYKPPTAGSNVNITNVAGVVVTGRGNVVNTHFSEAEKAARALRAYVEAADSLGDDEKLSILSDLDSLTMQLQKPKSNQPVIKMLWQSIKVAASIGGASELVIHLGRALGLIEN